MARGKQRDEWNRASLIVSKMQNLWSETKCHPNDFHPFEISEKKRKPKRMIKNPAELGMGGTMGVVQ